jgi:DNA-binding NtrC family response regulator
VFTIYLPGLRDRRKDIPLLAKHFLEIFSAKINRNITKMSDEFISTLQKHDWKGNIRELKNVIERAVILADGDELSLADLPVEMQSVNLDSNHLLSAFDLSSVEKLHIQRVLNHCKGNKAEAARLLNIGLTTLYRKIEEYKIY